MTPTDNHYHRLQALSLLAHRPQISCHLAIFFLAFLDNFFLSVDKLELYIRNPTMWRGDLALHEQQDPLAGG